MNFVEAKPLPGQNQARGHHSSHLPAEDDLRAQAVDVKPLASGIHGQTKLSVPECWGRAARVSMGLTSSLAA